ncbi:hypothetical protein EMN47_17980 [Prolixibacteraceae bacterium JC049]|nr:hypothetical protein [Prolixibacteraceae bacterium JC049]
MRASVIALLFISIFVSCGPSDSDRANFYNRIADEKLKQSDTLMALTYYDSTKMIVKAVAQVKMAKQKQYAIYNDLKGKLAARLDSNKVQIQKLEKQFVRSKGDFDRYYQYTHKRQTFDRAWDRSFIRIYLDERGEIYLSSNYYGEQWLNHTGLRVYDGKLQAKTAKVALDDPNNHRSEFDKGKWEKVTYRGDKDNGVIQFIADNVEKNLKAVFLGKRYYYIILEKFDKEAVRDALALSKALKAKKKLELQMKAYASKMEKL